MDNSLQLKQENYMDSIGKLRRVSLAFGTAIVLLTYSACLDAQQTSSGNGQGSTPQVRMWWQDFISGPDGAKRLARLGTAVQKMQSRENSAPESADFRRSWKYWANIHGYLGPKSRFGTVAFQIDRLKKIGYPQFIPYVQDIADQAPPDSIAQTVWATCEHSKSQTAQANFFGWHRMYLYYFERVLRWAANDNTLRLPYWDYTDPANVALPSLFQNTSSVFDDAKRDPGINNGSSTLDPNSTDVNNLLPTANYFSYELDSEEGFHGYVHCTGGPTCPVAHMGDVPVAGNDPIFYDHHDNIDRLWACWQKLHSTPGGSWQTQKFSFVDETGALVTKPVKDFIDTTKLGYVYENQTNCARPGTTLLKSRVAALTALQGAVLASSPGVAIKSPQTTIDLPVPREKLAAPLAQLDTAETMQLYLRDVTADRHPGTLFNVYLAKKGDPSSRQEVGTITWFNAFRHHGHTGPEKRTYHFDVTNALRALGGPAVADAGVVTVVIEATTRRVPPDKSKVAEAK